MGRQYRPEQADHLTAVTLLVRASRRSQAEQLPIEVGILAVQVAHAGRRPEQRQAPFGQVPRRRPSRRPVPQDLAPQSVKRLLPPSLGGQGAPQSGYAAAGRRVGPEHAETTREHTFRGITASIDRAREVLGYAPRYSTLQALQEALAWLVANGQADIGGQPFPGGS